MNTNDKDRLIQEYDEKLKQLKNEIQQEQNHFLKEHIKAFEICSVIFILTIIICLMWRNKDWLKKVLDFF